MGSGASKPTTVTKQHLDQADSIKKMPPTEPEVNGHSESTEIPADDDSESETQSENSQPLDNTLTGLARRLGYPGPAPPTNRKDELFTPSDYMEIDKFASTVNVKHLYKPFKEMAEYLTEHCESDLQKVRALFVFITSLDIDELQSSTEDLPQPDTTLDYVLKIHWQMGNHAHLFAQLARAADLPCLVVTGMNKSAAYELGGAINKESMGAQWNVVLVDGEWRFVDVYWASTCVVGSRDSGWALVDADGEDAENDDESDSEGKTVQHVNEFFFLPDPDKLISTHLPDEAEWQLLKEPWTPEEFERYVYIRERYYDIGMSLLPESITTCAVKTRKGESVLTFGCPPELAGRLQFRYLLFKYKQRGESEPAVPFEKFVFFQKSRHAIRFTARFPIAGKFKLDVFGQVAPEHEAFDLVCSYLIVCNDPQSNFKPLPDMPDIGWGPGVEAENAGLVPITHEDAVIKTEDGVVEVRFSVAESKAVMQRLRSNDIDEATLEKHACIREENGEVIINLRLPQTGDYALNIFAGNAEEEAILPNVCNYLVECLGTEDKDTIPFPKCHLGKLGPGHLPKTIGVEALSHKGNIIEAPDGYTKVSLKCSEGTQLTCELCHSDIDSEILTQAIERNISNKVTDFDIVLPSRGEYALNVFASTKKEPDRISHVHTYLINSGKSNLEKVQRSEKQLPVNAIYCDKEYTEIRIPSEHSNLVAELHKKDSQDAPKSTKLRATQDGDNKVFKLKLPQVGDYNFDLYEERKEGSLVHKSTVKIVRQELTGEEKVADPTEHEKIPTPEVELSPEKLAQRKKQRQLEGLHKSLVEQLKAAIAGKDPTHLRKSIKDFQHHNVPGHQNELEQAQNLLNFLTVSQALTTAMNERNQKKLEAAISTAEKCGLHKKLHLQMKMARNILEQLRRIDRLRHAIMDLDQKTIAEIKSYSQPPEAVHSVMMATFLLLGEKEKYLRKWKKVQIHIGKTGKESLKRRVSEFNLDKLDIQVAVRANQVMKKFSLDDVRDVSSGAATFYVWAKGITGECESRFTQAGGDMAAVEGRKSAGKRKSAGQKNRNHRK